MISKAAVLYELGQPLVVEYDLTVPKLRRGQVFVELAYSGVCRSQWMEVKGYRGPDRHLPHALGHEGVGVVLETGPDVSRVRCGDMVMLSWMPGAGIDSGGTHYLKGSRLINAGPVTTFSSHSVVSENRCFLWPRDLAPEIGVLFGCALPTGAGLVRNCVKLTKGDAVCIVGLGGVGLSALVSTLCYELTHIIVIEPDFNKRQLALELGATIALEPARNVIAQVMDVTNGEGVDVAIEAAGSVSSIQLAFDLIKYGGGQCVFASHPRFGDKLEIDPFDLIRGKTIRGSWGGEADMDTDYPLLVKEFAAGGLPLDKLIENPSPLEDINEVLDSVATGKLRRPLIAF